MKSKLVCVFAFACAISLGNAQYLVKFKSGRSSDRSMFVSTYGGQLEAVSATSRLAKWTVTSQIDLASFSDDAIEYIQPNYRIFLFENPSLESQRSALLKAAIRMGLPDTARATDNPEIQSPGVQAQGTDPLLNQAWGMSKIGADSLWSKGPNGEGIIVAVTDTGVDYNHPDLIANMWRNPKEIPGDGIDNDNNGYIDDIVGWDFFSKDSKPFDLTMSLLEILLKGGNPGHGTHVAGVVGAKWNNAIGTSGVAPQAKIMALRFISEQGQGDTAGAIGAIDYAVANGAKIINASWGSEGEEAGDVALRECITRAEKAGVIFVAAAGNGRVNQAAGTSAGYNNDTDAKPSFPASYPHENIVAVAATDSEDKLASFSNFGVVTVDIGAPGVKILSTVPGGKYQDTVIDLGQMKATWDGTSMASPFVAGSLAVAWSMKPTATWKEVKAAVLGHASSVSALSGKVATGGRLDVKKLN